ncbi:34822_t:CDS:2 [Gigaspora margarita]|uniref:34822_t:CDS:1 n=1 Tax=Gigaspora margarita TaxID=4874 RepID=A0ABN7UV41_GIGMA|nr:34822_t:CDS:2 [Gigaspora margarita]
MQLVRDQLKRELCDENCIVLIEIWYYEDPDIVIPEFLNLLTRDEVYKHFDEQLTSGHIHIIVQPLTAKHVVAYEGVNLTLGIICKKESTIDIPLKYLLERRNILVQSQPKCVFQILLLWMERSNKLWTFVKRFKELMNMTWDKFFDKCGNTTIFLIIDEVQKIYKPENEDKPCHGGNVFWDSFKYILQFSRLYIVAFALYGHYRSYTLIEIMQL